MAVHRYWRLFFAGTAGAAYAFAEVQFRTTPGTPLLFSGGTASAAETFSGFPASNAADNNTTTLWSGNDAALNQWWAYDYGAGNTRDIREVTITARNDANFSQAPSLFQLQFSDDNSTWTNAQPSPFSATWASAGQTQTFTVSGSGSTGLIWTDTFESYATGAVPSPWVNVSNSNVSTAQAHAGTKSLGAGAGGLASNCYRAFGSNVSQWYADFWMYTNSSGATTNQYIAFTPDTSSSGNCCSVNVSSADGSGRCGVSNSTAWFTFSVSLNTWHHYILEVTSGASGTAKLTVDGTVVGTYSGDTRDSAAHAYVAYAWLTGASIGPSPPAEFYVDDLSVYSGAAVGAASQARVMVMA